MGKIFKSVRDGTVLILVAVIISGCATMVSGPRQDVTINSVPSGATVKVNGLIRGRSPVILALNRKKRHIIRIEKEGYQAHEMTLSRGVNGWVFGNILIPFGILIGPIVDFPSGAAYAIKPKYIQINLVEDKTYGR